MRSEIAEHSQCATKMIGIAMRDEQRVEGPDAPRPHGRRQHTGAHVDSPEGRKGIFWNLGKVQRGDTVAVTRKDGSTASFTVDRVKAYPKAEFPTDLVYKGDFTRSEIRLVTCGGPVDSRNEYRDNVVVFGHLTGAT